MTTLRVIVDQIVAPNPGGIGRYTAELTRELIATAPVGSDVAGIVSSSPEADYDLIAKTVPGLTSLYKTALARRELEIAWRSGFTRLPGRGMIHATGLFAPLGRHDRAVQPDEQIVVTIHDVIPWTHPETLPSGRANWHRAMAKRAQRFADAVIVPTHAVAEQLAEIMDFGDRIRVIGGAVSSSLALPSDANVRGERLGLPDRFILTTASLDARKGLVPLLDALSQPALDGVPLVLLGTSETARAEVSTIVEETGMDVGRVIPLAQLSDSDLAVALDRAAVFVFPSLAEGFGLPMVEAFSLGTPVVHSDDPAVLEVAAGAGITVPLDDAEHYADRLAAAIADVLGDDELAARLSVEGEDRARAFSWKDSAEKVWQLHADL